MTEALAVYEANQDVAIYRAPEIILAEAQKAAKALADVVSKKKKPVMMNGEQYLEFEDWQTVGKFYGVTAKIISTQYIEYGEAKGFEAHAVAIRPDGSEVSAAESMCLNDEPNWKGKPLFQLRSMAQTRAAAKALRNVLAWVVVLAGYRPTPAEEIQGMINGNKPPVAEPQKKAPEGEQKAIIAITSVKQLTKKKDGTDMKSPLYVITAAGVEYKTFSDTFAKTAKEALDAGLTAEIDFTVDKYGNNIVGITKIEPTEAPEPGSNG